MKDDQKPDCGANGCIFGGKGGQRTNGGCTCLAGLRKTEVRIFLEKLIREHVKENEDEG